jgi:hypothetical protein
MIDFFRGIPGAIGAALSGLGEIIKAPFEWAWEQIQHIAGDIEGAFTGAINAVRGVWNGFARGWNGIHFSIPSVDTHIPGIGTLGGGSFDLPNLPIVDRGGIITGPTLALLAANRRPEAVVPLDRGFGSTLNITVNVPLGAHPAEVGAATVDAIRAYERINGRSWRS